MPKSRSSVPGAPRTRRERGPGIQHRADAGEAAAPRRQGDCIWKYCGGAPTSLSPGRARAAAVFSPPLSLLSSPLSGGRSGGGSPVPAARGRWAAGLSPPAPLPGGRVRWGGAPPPSLLPPSLLSSPLSGGRSGGGSRPWVRRRPAGLARSANEDAGLRPARPAGRRRSRARCFFMDERDREGPRPGRRVLGSTPLPTSPPAGGRREDGVSGAVPCRGGLQPFPWSG